MSERESVHEVSEKNTGESGKKEWREVRLKKVLSFEYGDNLPSSERNAGDVPVYGANGQVGTHSEASVNKPGVIIGRKGSIAETVFSNEPFWPIDTTYYISNDETDENLLYIHYLLDYLDLDRFNAASAIPGLNRNDAYNLRVKIATRLEQQKIASILHNVDQAIQKTEKIIEQTQRVKKGLMQDLFTEGYYDHKEIEKHPTLGKYPANWEVKKIEEIGKVNADSFSLEDYNEDTFGYITLSNVSEGQILQIEKTPTNDAPSRAKRKVKSGDVLIGTVRPKQRSHAQVPEEHDGKVCSTGFAVISPENMNPDYLSQEIFTHRFFSQMEAYVAGSGYPAVKNSDVKKIRVVSPPKDEQEKIAETLQNYDNELEKLQEGKEQLRRIKKGLMQDLLTGNVRTKDKNIEVLDEVLDVEKS